MSPMAALGRIIQAVLLLACIAALLLALCAPAQARVLAEAPMEGGAVVLLHDEAGPCVGGAQLAQYISAAGEMTPGCWVLRPSGRIAVVFLDGDISAIEPASLRVPKSS